MLNNLTIVIITFKRYGFLKRQLNFYLSYKSQAKVLILDSTPYDPEDKELQLLLSHENVEWKKYDQNIFFPEKIALGCQYIETEYAVLSADDDFLIPTSLELCTNFLRKHSQYSSAHGLWFKHMVGRGFIKKTFWLDPLYTGKASSLEEKTGANRITKYLHGESPYYPFYAVHSTNIFRLIWQETTKHVKHQGLSEFFPSCISFAYGKMKVFPVFYGSREPNNFTAWEDKETLQEVYSEEKITMAVTGLAPHLAKLDYLELKSAESLLQNAFKVCIMRQGISIEDQLLVNPPVLISFFKIIKKWLKDRTQFYNWITNLIDYKTFYKSYHSSINRDNSKDFKKIKELVLSSELSFDELNEARKQVYYLSEISKQNQK